MAVMDALAEDDGPVFLERRRSRHGNYYEEIPPEPEPEPVPVEPEHVPETMADKLDAVYQGISTMKYYASTGTIAPGTWNPTTVAGNSWNSTSGYSISLNDVIGAGKGYQPVSTGFGSIEGVYDPPANMQVGDYVINDNGSISVQTPNGPMYALPDGCGHQYYDDIGPAKYKFPKNGKGGKTFQRVKCQGCGHEWNDERQF